MRLPAFLAVCASMLMLGCSGLHEPMAPTASLAPAESPDYAVYDAVLDGLASESVRSGTQPYYVVADSTDIDRGRTVSFSDPYYQRQFGPVLAPVVAASQADYLERGRTRVGLDARAFNAGGRVELVSNVTLAELSRGSAANPNTFWRAFYARFPGSVGLLSFSRPGYDATRTHALLYYGHGCGGLCGDGGYVLLERRDGKWMILRRVVTWMS